MGPHKKNPIVKRRRHGRRFAYLVSPFRLPGCGVERGNQTIGVDDVHDAVANDRARLVTRTRTALIGPLQFQQIHVLGRYASLK